MADSKDNSRKIIAPETYDIRDPHHMWREQPDLIRRFLEQRPDYEHLCTEVGYILTKGLQDNGIEVSTVTWRAKTLNSFLEKIERKKYGNPLKEIKDIAGIRVVYLFKQDEKQIEELIRKEFVVKEKVDKLEEKDADRFGYLATHYIARLGKGASGARYEDLKDLYFEIQVRTVLQDAWAVIDHHLAYKRESDIPKLIQRQLMRIAGTFEMVDEEFGRIQESTVRYAAELKESSQKSKDQFLSHDLNLDSFIEYIQWKFKGLPLRDPFFPHLPLNEPIFRAIPKQKYPTLLELDTAVNKADQTELAEAVKELESESHNSAGYQFSVALGLVDKDFYDSEFTPPWVSSAIRIASAYRGEVD